MHSVFLKTNVTNVKFIGHHLLAGIGGELHVYNDTEEKTTYWKHLCNIKVFPPQNIYGIFPKDYNILVCGGRKLALLEYSEPFKLSLHKNWSFDDWVLDVVWLDNESNVVAILTANNIVHKYNLTSEETVSKLKSEELCILYSGQILNTIWEELVILAGTVFQEILIWKQSIDDDSHTRILHRLQGHKGVIFSVNYNARSKLICSSSDDRTVRIWLVQFRSKEKNKQIWKECTVALKVTIFSHVARVWKSQIITGDKIISIGEDSLISIWNQQGDCVNQWYGHQGGAVWSVDFSEELSLIATGGSDGGINVWPVCDSVLPINTYQGISPVTNNVPRSVALTSSGSIILMTNHGAVKYYNDKNWVTCFEDKRFASYCLLQMSPNRSHLALGNILGDVIICKVENHDITKVWEGNILKGRIFSLFWLTESIILTCGSDGELVVWQFLRELDTYLKSLRKYLLPSCKERWITTALLIGEFILCGDRCGSIHLYELNGTQKEPLHSARKLHGYKGVSSIKLIDGKIISTGRDGTYRQLEISENIIQNIDCNKLQMEWIASIEDTLLFGTVIIGFHDAHLIIWSCRESRPLIKMDCGGGHRSWDYFIDESLNSLRVIFIKDKGVYSYSRPLNLVYHRTAEVGYHSKSINSACLLDCPRNSSDFILTGGEDNTLRLFHWDNNTFSPTITLHRHISSIRAIYCLKDTDRNCFFIASCGGRGQLIIWRMIECEGKVKMVECASHMVRATHQERGSKQTQPLPDPETRHMDVNIVKLSENTFIILTGCSDGLLRLFTYNADKNEIILTKVCHFHNHCILKVAHFIWEKHILAITMTTEGKVAFWNVNTVLRQQEAEIKPYLYSLHSLGINSYSLCHKNNILILASGSDDSTLAITAFELKKNRKHTLITSWIEKTLHTCQISGVQILKDFIISVALDQKISLLKWKFNNGYLTVSLVRQVMTSVPDVHGLLAWIKPQNSINVCVYGLGIEMFKEIQEKMPEENLTKIK